MPEDQPSLADLLEQVRFFLARPVDFSSDETESLPTKVRVLTAATYFNTLSVADFGGRAGPARAPGLVEQVVAAAFQTFADVDPHPSTFDKAAMLLRGITQGHPFNDGNKRTGFLLAAYYLLLAGLPAPTSLDEDGIVDLSMRVSAGEVRDVEEIARELRMLWEQ